MRILADSAALLLLAAPPVLAQAPGPPPLADLAHAVGFGHFDGQPMAAGRDYKVQLRGDGFAFVPALGDRAPHNMPLDLVFAGASCGGARLDDGRSVQPDVLAGANQVRWSRGPSLTEILDVTPDGVELSWRLDVPPAGPGDLVIELHVATELPLLEEQPQAVLFANPALGGVRVGAVTGRDAAGREVAGSLAFEPAHDGTGRLLLSLPGSFVHAARYPLVLDPPVTAWVPAGTGVDWPVGALRHDAVVGLTYTFVDALVVWVADFSLIDHDILGREVIDPAVAPPQPLLMLEASGFWDDLPEISAPNQDGWSLLAWVRKEGTSHRIRGLLAKPDFPAAGQVIGTPSDITGLDASLARPGVNAALSESTTPLDDVGCVVYGTTSGEVRSVRVLTEALGPGNTLFIGGSTTLASSVPNALPTISRTRLLTMPTLVAWTEADGVHGLMLGSNGLVAVPQKLLKPAGFTPVAPSRVDGSWGNFALVTSEDHPTGALRIALTYVDGALNHSPHYVMSDEAIFTGDAAVAQDIAQPGSGLLIASSTLGPPLGTVPVETWGFSKSSQGTLLDVLSWGAGAGMPVDSPSISINDEWLAVTWVDAAGNVLVQFGTPWGFGGTITPLGLPCGDAGVLAAYPKSPEAALGNYQFSLAVNGGSPLATVALLNLGLPGPPAACGACAIAPLQLLVPMTLGFPTFFYFKAPLPGDPVLAGLTFEAQAIEKTPGAGGCGGIPNWSFSNRLHVTVDY